MASPCNNSPEEVIEKIVSAKANADKFDKFVNGTDTQTVQIGSGDPTPTIRNAVRQIMADASWAKNFIANAPEGDVSLNNVTALGADTSRTLAERFSDVVNVSDYGAKGDGVTDDTNAIKAAIQAGIDSGKKLFFDGGKTYVISGSNGVIFKTGADFNGSTLDISNIENTLGLCSPGEGWIEDQAALSLLSSGEDTPNQTAKIPAWAEYTGVSNHYIRLETNQYFYTYRGEDKDREEINFVTDWGHLLSPIKYAIDVSSVTSVQKLAYNRKTTEYSNVNFKIGDRDPTIYSVVAVNNSSNVRLKNISFDVDNAKVYDSETMFTLLAINSSAEVEIDNVYFGSTLHREDFGGNYCLSIAGSYDVIVKKAIGQGAGWGATGNNNAWKVVFRDCDLSRIDFHQPFREYLKVKDCMIGRHGITVTSIGDLYVDNCTFVNENSTLYVSDEATWPERATKGIISARGELGGLCDGNVFINKCKIINNIENTYLFRCVGTSADVTKNTSPIKHCFWHSITVKDVDFCGSEPVNLSPLVTANCAPQTITYKDIHGEVFYSSNFDEGVGYYEDALTNIRERYLLQNIESLISFKMIHNSSGNWAGNKSVVLENVNYNLHNGVDFEFYGSLEILVKSSEVHTFKNFASRSLKFISCRVNSGSEGTPFICKNSNDPVFFENCIFMVQPTKNMFLASNVADPYNNTFSSVFGHINFSGNRIFRRPTSVYRDAIVLYEGDPAATVSINAPSGFKNGLKNTYVVAIGYSDEYDSIPVVFAGKNSGNVFYFNEKPVKVEYYSGAETITITTQQSDSIPVRSFSILI